MKRLNWFIPGLLLNISGVIFLALIAISGFAAGNTEQIPQTKGADSIPKLWGTTQTVPGPEEWQASWIWIKGETSGTDLVLLARKQFILAALPKQARLFITADNNYELYVNGQFVNRGPVRCQPHHQSYDIIEIASLLKEGENVLALRVLHQGRFGSYNTPPRPGILAQLEVKTDTKMEIIKSDSSWKVKKPEGTNLNSPIFGELIDFRKEEKSWKEVRFDDSKWSDAEELLSDRFWPWPEPSPRARAGAITFPWETLVPRDIPYLNESLVKGVNLFEVGEILELGFNNAVAEGANGLLFPGEKVTVSGLESYKKGEGPLTIQNSYPSNVFSNEAIYSTYLIFDLGELMHGYPHLELEGSAGSIVEILYAPHLIRGKFPLRTDISGRPLTDRIILSGGKTVWDAIEMKYMRFLFIAVRNTDKPVKLFFSGLNRADYPFEPKGNFTAGSDNELEWLWQAATNTLRAITTDAFTDNYRERLQYAQTSYYAARCSYAAFGDSYLQKQYLQQIAQEQQSDGVLPAAAPVTGYRGGRFLDASLFWIMGLHDYLLHTGDTKTVQELLPAAEKVMNRFKLWENKDGIIDSPPYPYWIDHADVDRYGANFSLNALYSIAIQNYASISKWIGNDSDALEYETRAEKLNMFLRINYWDTGQKLFSDTRIEGKLSIKFTEQSNSLAIVAGIATAEQRQEIVKEFIENKSARLVPAVLFMHYLTESLFMTGHGEQALTILKDRYRHMKTEGLETLWEEWSLTASKKTGQFKPESGRSCAQGEQTFLAYSLTRWLLGIQPIQPGMSEVRLSCNLSGLPEVKGSMPCPQGLISVAWSKTKKGTCLEVDIPVGIRAFVDLNSPELMKRKISIDGNPATRIGENPEIQAGKHILYFY